MTNKVIETIQFNGNIAIIGEIEGNYGYVVVDIDTFESYAMDKHLTTKEIAVLYTNDENNETEDGFSVYGFDTLEDALDDLQAYIYS